MADRKKYMNSWIDRLCLYGVILLTIIASPPVSRAGQNTSGILGTAMEAESGSPLENATVQILETNTHTITDSNGIFLFSSLPPGEYRITVRHVAYMPEHRFVRAHSIGEPARITVTMHRRTAELPAIVVTGTKYGSHFDEVYALTNVKEGKELQRDMGQTLAATLKDETGLAIRSMGPAPARPVIRGLSGDRVVITEDGIPTNDLSATSPDHAVTVEPFTVEKIEVVRGPKVLLNTSTTVGGVVNVIRDDVPLAMPERFTSEAGVFGESASGGHLGSFQSLIPVDPFALKIELSDRRASDINTPAGKLQNTYVNSSNYAGGLSLIKPWGVLGVSARQFDTDYGIPGGFVGAHPRGVDISMLRRNYNLKGLIHLHRPFLDNVEFHVSRTYYHHTEYEKSGSIGAEFLTREYVGRVLLNHGRFGMLDNGSWGVSFDTRTLRMGGYVFTPPTDAWRASFFLYENVEFARAFMQFAARFNHNRYHPKPGNPSTDIGLIRDREFSTLSLSLSLLRPVFNGASIGANLSRTTKVPTAEELYNEGPHLAAYSYETGNPDLESERGIGFELFGQYKHAGYIVSATFFLNDFSYYITPRNTGAINWAQLLPVYAATGAPARFHGLEMRFEKELPQALHLTASLTWTEGTYKDTSVPLPMIPPFKGHLELIHSGNPMTIGLSAEIARKQDRLDTFEQPTPGYGIINAFIQRNFQSGKLVHSLSLSLDNILDQEYRNHLSRVKSIMPEAGRNVRLTYRVYY